MNSEKTTAPAAGETDCRPRAQSWLARIDAVLEHGSLGCIGLLLFASVAFMGGRYDWDWLAWTQCVLVSTAALATLLWILRLTLRPELGLVWSWSLVLLAAGALIGALQLVELPKGVLELCSPGLASVLPLGRADGAGTGTFGPWTCASLAPARTAEGLRYFALYCLTFFLVIQNVRTVGAVRQMLRLIFSLGVAVAFFGIAQYLLWNGKFYWCFEVPWVPSTNWFRCPFTNKNHFAGFLAMAVGPGCYCLLSMLGLLKTRRSSAFGARDYFIPIGCFAFGCVLAAAFLSVSRGGIIATTVGFVLATAGLTCYAHSKRIWLFVACLTCIGFAVLMGFAGTEQIEERLATLGLGQAAGTAPPEARLELWQALLGAVRDFPVLGAGVGTHEYVCPLYLNKWYPGLRFTHAENSYLQLLVEGGISTAVLVALALGAVGYWCVSSLRGTKAPEAKPCTIAVAAGLSAAAVHATVDFVWYIPSHALMLAVLAGLALALARAQRPAMVLKFPLAPRCWVGMTALTLGLLLAAWLQTSYHHAQAALHWTEFQRSVTVQGGERPAAEEAPVNLAVLRAAVEERPDHPMYAAALAECYRQHFLRSKAWRESSMPILQLRAAVEVSKFSSPETRDAWLDSAYGWDNRILLTEAHEQFCQAIRLCPLNAHAYLRLAELHFMAGEGGPSASALLQQAVKVRPYDPDICYEVGVDFISQGDMVQGMRSWRQSALVSEKHKQTVLAQLVQVVPLEQLVEHYQPDYSSLIALVRERFNRKDERKARLYLLVKAKEATLEGLAPEVVGPRMGELHYAFLADGEQQEAGDCVRVAVAAEPNLVSTRLMLIRWLVQQGSFKEARPELDWCALRAPENAEVQALRARVFEAVTDYRSQKTRARRAPN